MARMKRTPIRETPKKRFICRHCKVDVVSKTNTKAIIGRQHGKHCPRRNQ